jgi:hypothetical protein
MRKSHRHDKRLSPQGGLQGRHARAVALIPRNGVSADLQAFDRAIW